MTQAIRYDSSTSAAWRLFLCGFLTLFLELALIRYLAGSIWNMGYFPNLVLMAVFIGMGLGFLFHQRVPEDKSPHLFHAGSLVLLLLIGCAYFFHPVVPGFNKWSGDVGGEVFFTSAPKGAAEGDYIIFFLIFAGVVLLCAIISQRAAKLFRQFPPLKAYSLDISGSCAGILAFMAASWLEMPAFTWFLLAILLFLGILERRFSRLRLQASVALLLTAFLVWKQDAKLMSDPDYQGYLEVHWSPYQKVEFVSEPIRYIFVNGVGHQRLSTNLQNSYYQIPHAYRLHRNKPPFQRVLVIGAGSGNDVAAALQNGAAHLDAIEIDPVIARLGLRYHPDEPYGDSRVNLVVDDARAFMSYTHAKYDLIIFALTDSLVKVSPVTQLRLENYIFTRESISRAYELLTPDGCILFYNFYRLPWVKQKIEQMTYLATGNFPVTIYRSGDFAMMVVDKEKSANAPAPESKSIDIPTDDWPFLYLVQRGVPSIYLKAMILMVSFIFLLAFMLQRSTRNGKSNEDNNTLIKIAFAFMGIAFLLLETKSVIQFSLLFGTTWLNNSLVFLAILSFVLIANWVASWLRQKWVLGAAYCLLILFCILAIGFPLSRLLVVDSFWLRFLFASVLTFSPIFFANLIFSISFRERKLAEHLFGWNLIGAALGGVLEYFSMAIGYNALSYVVAILYTLVFAFFLLHNRTRRTAAEVVPIS